MTWPEAAEKIALSITVLIVIGIFLTGRWPWERDK